MLDISHVFVEVDDLEAVDCGLQFIKPFKKNLLHGVLELCKNVAILILWLYAFVHLLPISLFIIFFENFYQLLLQF